LEKDREGGRSKINDRKVMSIIFFVLKTGCQRRALLRSVRCSTYLELKKQSDQNSTCVQAKQPDNGSLTHELFRQ
jgi:transposase